MSKVGKEIPIKAVVGALPSYTISISKSPFLFLELPNKKLHHFDGKIVIPNKGFIGKEKK